MAEYLASIVLIVCSVILMTELGLGLEEWEGGAEYTILFIDY